MIKKMLFICLLLFGTTGAHAYAMEPDELIQKTTEQLLNEFTINRANYEADLNRLYLMVNRIAIPHFDFERMTEIVLGKHYGNATDEQRYQFTEEFQTLLVRTYSQALFQYSDEKISYIPAVPYRNGMMVREEIEVGAAVPVRLDYFLAEKTVPGRFTMSVSTVSAW